MVTYFLSYQKHKQFSLFCFVVFHFLKDIFNTMFKSLGKLKRCCCVFYAAGLCARPNCLYKHPTQSERESERRSRYARTEANFQKEKVHVPAKAKEFSSSPPLKYSSIEKNSATMETKKRPFNSVDYDDTTDSGNANENKKLITTLNIVNNSDSAGNSPSGSYIEISNSNSNQEVLAQLADCTDDSKTTFTQMKELSRIVDKEATNEIEMKTESIRTDIKTFNNINKGLPDLRHSLATNELKIDGIKPPLLSSTMPAAPVTDLIPQNQAGNTNDEKHLITVNIVKNSDSQRNSPSSSDISPSLSNSFIANSNVEVVADCTDDSKTTYTLYTQMKDLSPIGDKEITNEIEMKSELVSKAIQIFNNITNTKNTNDNKKHLTNVNIVKNSDSRGNSPSSSVCSSLSNSFIANSNVEVFADYTDDSKKTSTQMKDLSRIVNEEANNEIEMKTESISKPIKKEDHSRIKTLKPEKSTAVMSPALSISKAIQSRIPDQIRQKMLERIHKEYCQMDKNSVAIVKAITCEQDAAMNCNLKKVYFASISTRILGIRRLVKQFKLSRRVTNIKTGTPNNSERDAVLAQQSSNESSKLTLFAALATLALNPEDMMRFGYPISHKSKYGRATYYKIVDGDTKKMGKTVLNKDVRNCDRCKSTYRVNEDGYPAREETCLYHYGQRLESVEKGETGLWYTCCNGESGSEGCTDAPAHVSNDPGCKFFRRGFVESVEMESFWDIISMDCSMVYTTVAKELAKITIVGINKEILYEQLVMPRNPILDYNSRSSDITEEKLFEGPTVYLEDVQTFLLTNISPNTIIIGHNLDSGLKAVKLIHTKVVDTAILFSKGKGSRTNHSLETLSGEFCRSIIASSSSKYNSFDNAITALELAILKANKIRNKRDNRVKNKLSVSAN